MTPALWRGTPFWWKALLLFLVMLVTSPPPGDYALAGYAGRATGLLILAWAGHAVWPSGSGDGGAG